jgi:hypothetical protein
MQIRLLNFESQVKHNPFSGYHTHNYGRMSLFAPNDCPISNLKREFTGHLQATNCMHLAGCQIIPNRADNYGTAFNKGKITREFEDKLCCGKFIRENL